MHEKRYARVDVDAILSSLKGKHGLSPEVLRLVEEDLCSGMSKEDVMKYCTRKVGIGRMRILSRCIRKGIPDDVAGKLSECEGREENLEVAFDLLGQGVSIEKFEDALNDRERLLNVLMEYKARNSALKREKSQEGANNGLTEASVEDLASEKAKTEPEEGCKAEVPEGRIAGEGGLTENEGARLSEELREFLSAFRTEALAEIARAVENAQEDRIASREELLSRTEAQLREKDEMLVMQSKALTEARRTIAELEDRMAKMERTQANGQEGVAEREGGEGMKGLPVREGKEEPEVKGKEDAYAEDFMLRITDAEGRVIGVAPVERHVRRSGGIGGICAALGFKKRSRKSLMQKAISGELCREQLIQVVEAIRCGLTEAQLCSLMDNKVPAEKMPQIIEIARLENEMGYNDGGGNGDGR